MHSSMIEPIPPPIYLVSVEFVAAVARRVPDAGCLPLYSSFSSPRFHQMFPDFSTDRLFLRAVEDSEEEAVVILNMYRDVGTLAGAMLQTQPLTRASASKILASSSRYLLSRV